MKLNILKIREKIKEVMRWEMDNKEKESIAIV